MASDSVPVSMVMTCDNAVETTFVDGSRVQLSPCGSCFMYDPPASHGIQSHSYQKPDPGPSHPLYASSRTQQRTCFVTSRWRSKVVAALEFRNRFASRPFLCPNLSQEESRLELYADITQVEWSTSNGKYTFNEHPDHSVELTSADSLATVILSPSGQDFSVKYLCKLQPEIGAAADSRKGTDCPEMQRSKSGKDLQAYSTNFSHTATSCTGDPDMTHGHDLRDHPVMPSRISSEQKVPLTRSRCRFCYTWVVQNHSVAHCPRYWRYPVDMLLQRKAEIMKKSNLAEISDAAGNDFQNSKCDDVPVQPETHSSPLPQSLPLRCDESHLHKHHWRTIKQECAVDKTGDAETLTMYGRKVSVLVVGGVVYRLFWDPVASIEIYPGNGDVIESRDERGSFFRLIKVKGDGALAELMISITNPPPDTSSSPYSIAELVRRGSRLLQCIIVHQRTSGAEDTPCCWKNMEMDDMSGNAGELVERSIIHGLGQLEAYSNGLIRGYFDDEVTMETNCLHRVSSNGQMDAQVVDEDDTTFTVMLPDGCRKLVTSRNPGAYFRHINALLEWIRWAWKSPEQQLIHIKEEPRNPNITENAVQTELLRIRNLTYMIDASNHGGIPDGETRDLTDIEGYWGNDVTTTSRLTELNDGSSQSRDFCRLSSENLTDDDIAKALRDTASAVCDIEGLLGCH